ncbi:hypothetical protein C2S52_021601 [Perilla frutescens var. hirtella]|nr:hypothetical protein C2S52_021601 [Perilla frutescens var. hirtella]
MAATSKSPHSVQAHNSRQSRRHSAARGVQSPPHISLSETVDQEQFVTSCCSAPSDTIPHSKIVDASGSLAVDDSAAGADAQLENSENGGSAKKPAWNKPSSGAAAIAAEVGAVMGAESWPALSDSARASPKSSLVLSNGSIVISEGILAGSLSPKKEPDTSISTPSHVAPIGQSQRSTKRGGDSPNHNRMAANGSLSQAPSMLGAFAGAQQHNAGNPGGSSREYSKEDTHRVSGQRGRSFGGNELHSQHGSFRSNSGPQARTDGSYHHRHGARRDSHRRENFTSQKRDGPRPFVRGPSPNGPFMPPPPPVVMRPFVNPMVYHEVPHVYFVQGPHLDSPRPMPMVSYSPMLFPMTDPQLATKILNQIEYYFSNENLVKDTYLRRNMDSEGWISIKLIATFKKVMQLTDNIHLILDAIQASNVVELQGDKVRRRSDWIKWLMPPAVTSRSIHDSSQDNLAADFNRVALREKAAT